MHCRIYILGQIRILIQKLSKGNIVPISLVETTRNCHSSGEGLLVQDVYLQNSEIKYINNNYELSVVCTTYPLRTLAGLSFDPPVGAFKFLDGLVFIQMKMIRTPSLL